VKGGGQRTGWLHFLEDFETNQDNLPAFLVLFGSSFSFSHEN